MGKRTVRDVQKHKLQTRNDSGYAFFYRIVILAATDKKRRELQRKSTSSDIGHPLCQKTIRDQAKA